jgi:DNA repair protein RadC
MTEAMIEAGRLIQIPLKDHVIIGKAGFRFLRDVVARIFETRI